MPDYRDPFGDNSPGPYVTLRVSWGDRHRDILALIDTGADFVQIPAVVADALELRQVDTVETQSAHGDWEARPIWRIWSSKA